MQTFLPFSDFNQTASVLDNKRLHKQAIEAAQILDMIRFGGRWQNHPAVLQWRGYEDLLLQYALIICDEKVKRFSKGPDKTHLQLLELSIPLTGIVPTWLGVAEYHSNHRSRLSQKKPGYYPWDEPEAIGNLWPITKTHGSWVFMLDGKVVGNLYNLSYEKQQLR